MKIISLTFSVILILFSLVIVILWQAKKTEAPQTVEKYGLPAPGYQLTGKDLQPAAEAKSIPLNGIIK